MANQQLPGVLVLDTAADNIIASGTPVRVTAVSLTGCSAASGPILVGDAGFSTAAIGLSVSAANGNFEQPFLPPVVLSGLKLSGTLNSGVVRVFCL